MPDYNNGKIYKIVCNITQECYVGSTTQPLSKRLAQHVTDYKRYLLGKDLGTSSYPILERGNYDIVLLEEVKCDKKEQLHMEERKHIEANVCVNHNIPTRTKCEYMTQWRNENKEHVKACRKDYNEAHKEHRKEYAKRYLSQKTEEQITKKKEYDKQYHEAKKKEMK